LEDLRKLKEVFKEVKIYDSVAQLVEHPDFHRVGSGFEFIGQESLKKFSRK
jgi:hypothetical protein